MIPTARVLRAEPGPGTLKETRWGGSRLARLRGAAEQRGRTIGESWEFSTLEGSESRADGRPLSRVLGRPLPFLAKLIDTQLALSIQVHPEDDAIAGVPGKEEAWIILEADPGAYVLAGLRAGIDAPTLARLTHAAIDNPERGAALIDAMTRVEVEAGTVILVPAGTVHAIGAGILLAEIQQPSDRTYRLFDYGSGRDLHVVPALSATRIDARATIWRPGMPSARVCGRHLELLSCPSGNHHHDASGVDVLVVAVSGGVSLRAQDEQRLAPGDLRLCTGGSFELAIGPGGLAVVGMLPG